MAEVANVNELLDGHVALDLECLDRLYLNAYVPNLQVSGQVVTFLCDRLGAKVPSPALFNKIGNGFRKAVLAFADDNRIPLVRFAKGDRKAEVMRPYLAAARHPGVVAIGVAQEFQSVFTGHDRHADRPGPPCYAFAKADRRVSVFYLSVRGPPVNGAFLASPSWERDRAVPQPGSSWSARSEARTNELDVGEERRTLCRQGEARSSQSTAPTSWSTRSRCSPCGRRAPRLISERGDRAPVT